MALLCAFAGATADSVATEPNAPAPKEKEHPWGTAVANVGTTQLTPAATEWGLWDPSLTGPPCTKASRVQMRATFFIDDVTDESLFVDKVRISWRGTRTDMYGAGYVLVSGNKTHASGPSPEDYLRGERLWPAPKGHRDFTVSQTIPWSNSSSRQSAQLFMRQNAQFNHFLEEAGICDRVYFHFYLLRNFPAACTIASSALPSARLAPLRASQTDRPLGLRAPC